MQRLLAKKNKHVYHHPGEIFVAAFGELLPTFLPWIDKVLY